MVVGEMVSFRTNIIGVEIIYILTAVLSIPVLFDWTTSIVNPVLLEMPVATDDTDHIYWHVSTSSQEDFAQGIIFTANKTKFLGTGFYAWPDANVACRYMPIHQPKCLVAILVTDQDSRTLTRTSIQSKISWSYMILVTTWAFSSIYRRSVHPRKIEAVRTKLIGHSDVIVAPALGMPWKGKQVVFRDSPQCAEILGRAQIITYPIEQ